MLKRFLQKLLHQIGLYERLKVSCVYDAYWTMADKGIIDARSREIEFYRKLFLGYKAGDLIFDVGANHGRKTQIFLSLGARVVAVEPDDYNQHVLRRKFLSYRFVKKPVVIVGKAVSDQTTVETMWVNQPGSAMNTLSKKWAASLQTDSRRFGHPLEFAVQKEIQTITIEDLIASYGAPFFIKIDVEGYEPQALRGLQRAVPLLSFEVNLPEFRSEGLECIQRLGRLSAKGVFNYIVNCQEGLRLEAWRSERDFLPVFAACEETSIEVFWRSDQSQAP